MYTIKIQHYTKYNTYTIIKYGSSSWTFLGSSWLLMSFFVRIMIFHIWYCPSDYWFFIYDIIHYPSESCFFIYEIIHLRLVPFIVFFLSTGSLCFLYVTSISSFPFPPSQIIFLLLYHHSCLLFIFWDNKILCLIIIQIVHFLYRWSWLYVVRKLTRIRQVLEKVVERQRVPQVQKVPLQDISFIDQKL